VLKLRRLRHVPLWRCPRCGRPPADPIAAAAGQCVHCDDLTGKCAAGRLFVDRVSEAIQLGDWTWPCTSLGRHLVEIVTDDRAVRGLFCDRHSRQVAEGGTVWLASLRSQQRPALGGVA
jgi:hypothetical protein